MDPVYHSNGERKRETEKRFLVYGFGSSPLHLILARDNYKLADRINIYIVLFF